MKTLIKTTLLVLCAGLLCGAESVREDRPTVSFQREQTRGVVRVVLLSVNRTTVFTSKGFRNEKNQDIHAVPGLGIEYVVEALGEEPLTSKISGTLSIFVGDKNYTEFVAKNLSAGGVSGISSFQAHAWGEFAKKPEVKNPNRAFIYQNWHRGIRVPSGKVDLHIKSGFNDHSEDFVFKNVPLE